jgi:hypothetical protein
MTNPRDNTSALQTARDLTSEKPRDLSLAKAQRSEMKTARGHGHFQGSSHA